MDFDPILDASTTDPLSNDEMSGSEARCPTRVDTVETLSSGTILPRSVRHVVKSVDVGV